MTNNFVVGELGRAFQTAVTHEDAATRRSAEKRVEQWTRMMSAWSAGRVEVGSRRPVVGLPIWVTLEVLRGGFATGSALAESSLGEDELAMAARLGLPNDRRALFMHLLTDAGMDELTTLLDAGTYRVEVPEDAALLVVAWLATHGQRAASLNVLEELWPLAGRLRFVPKVGPLPIGPPDHVNRIAVGEAQQLLGSQKPKHAVEVQREALAVWNPFSDRVVALWWERVVGDELDGRVPEEWVAQAQSLLTEYERLAESNTACTKHRKPKENLPILLRGLRSVAAGIPLDARLHGQVMTALRAVVAKRGAPGSPKLEELREEQTHVAQSPSHARLAHLAATRLDDFDPTSGLLEIVSVTEPISQHESAKSGLITGTAMPAVVERTMTRARSAPIETLIDEGVVPSAEVLASLIPQIAADVVAAEFDDEALRRLVSATYRAFRARRSLLLVDLAKQVSFSELPWISALDVVRTPSERPEALRVAHRVSRLALAHFPSTILPNPLVRELQTLFDAGGRPLPFTEELAADIFMGRFSKKFTAAAKIAAQVNSGTLYERYYGIDGTEILSLKERTPSQSRRRWWLRSHVPNSPVARSFSSIVDERTPARQPGGWSVAANGMAIEQAQILTTHNLALLTSEELSRQPAGSRPQRFV